MSGSLITWELGKAFGRDLERERIIGLLEKEAESWSSNCQKPLDPEHCQSCWMFVDLIALIKKGNNNASE